MPKKLSKTALILLVTAVIVVIIAITGVLMQLLNTEAKLQIGNVYKGEDINDVIYYSQENQKYNLKNLKGESREAVDNSVVLIQSMVFTGDFHGTAEVNVYPGGAITDSFVQCSMEIVLVDDLWWLVPDEYWYEQITGGA